ncbi:hypothetical protein BU16DRAFT_595898 [Lophium mytilinum]|uniref:Uncharacterized protein n=1 Tax=Lophium mytilinum TaxID=390894 RepID=A0A6A6QFF3_9PEZI|nr:hypothetical protein BU16DRAFT_595898 [Lophium mytilinum]
MPLRLPAPGFPSVNAFVPLASYPLLNRAFHTSLRSQANRRGVTQGLVVPMDRHPTINKTPALKTKHPNQAPQRPKENSPLTYFIRRVPVLAKEIDLRLQNERKQQVERPSSFFGRVRAFIEGIREARLLAYMLKAVLVIQEESKTLEVRRDETSAEASLSAILRCLEADNGLKRLGKGVLTETDRKVMEYCRSGYSESLEVFPIIWFDWF